MRLIWPNHPILPIAAPSPIWLELLHSLSFVEFLTTSFYSTEHFTWAISVHSGELGSREQFPSPQAPSSLCIYRFWEQLRSKFPKQIVLLLNPTILQPFHSDSPSSEQGAQSSNYGKLCHVFTGGEARAACALCYWKASKFDLTCLSKSQQSPLSPRHGPVFLLCLDKILGRKDTKTGIESSVGLA